MKKVLILLLIIAGGLMLYGSIQLLHGAAGLSTEATSQESSEEKSLLGVNFLDRASDLPSPSPAPPLPPIPSAKILPRGVQTFQTFNNCGPASLSMALSHYGDRKTQQEIGQQLRPYQNSAGDNDDKSVTLAELAYQAEQYGYVSYHRAAGDVQLLESFIANDIPVITRTWLKSNEDIGHYRVVKGYDDVRKVLIQDDSLQGANKEYAYAEFLELWKAFNYEFLVIVPKEKKDLAEQILGELRDEKRAWQKARELSTTAATEDPNDVYAHFNLSVAAYHLGQYQQAVAEFEKVEAKLPRRMLWYQIEPILAYYQVEDWPRVLSLTQKVLTDHNRAFSELHHLRGKVFETQNNWPAAEAAFREAARYNHGESWKRNLTDVTE